MCEIQTLKVYIESDFVRSDTNVAPDAYANPIIMPPTSKKLERLIASGLFVRPSVLRPSVPSSVRHAF